MRRRPMDGVSAAVSRFSVLLFFCSGYASNDRRLRSVARATDAVFATALVGFGQRIDRNQLDVQVS